MFIKFFRLFVITLLCFSLPAAPLVALSSSATSQQEPAPAPAPDPDTREQAQASANEGVTQQVQVNVEQQGQQQAPQQPIRDAGPGLISWFLPFFFPLPLPFPLPIPFFGNLFGGLFGGGMPGIGGGMPGMAGGMPGMGDGMPGGDRAQNQAAGNNEMTEEGRTLMDAMENMVERLEGIRDLADQRPAAQAPQEPAADREIGGTQGAVEVGDDDDGSGFFR